MTHCVRPGCIYTAMHLCKHCRTVAFCSKACSLAGHPCPAKNVVVDGVVRWRPRLLGGVRDQLVHGIGRMASTVDAKHTGLVYGYGAADAAVRRCDNCDAPGALRFPCQQCSAALYCSARCRNDHHQHQCPEFKAAPVYIDTAGMYHWRPVLPPRFRPVVGDKLTVMIRMRTDRMLHMNCNGCPQKHCAGTVHCAGTAFGGVPTAAQRVFNVLWRPQMDANPSHAFALFSVSASRQRFPGEWRLIAEQGIGSDDYRSGQGTMVCVRP